jgi:hypothetical protein
MSSTENKEKLERCFFGKSRGIDYKIEMKRKCSLILEIHTYAQENKYMY